jgi:hypothetical protein
VSRLFCGYLFGRDIAQKSRCVPLAYRFWVAAIFCQKPLHTFWHIAIKAFSGKVCASSLASKGLANYSGR